MKLNLKSNTIDARYACIDVVYNYKDESYFIYFYWVKYFIRICDLNKNQTNLSILKSIAYDISGHLINIVGYFVHVSSDNLTVCHIKFYHNLTSVSYATSCHHIFFNE